MARRLGVSPPTLQRLEEGTNHAALTLRELAQLAHILGLPLRELFVAEQRPDAEEPATACDDLRERISAALLHADALVPQADLAVACEVPVRELQKALREMDSTLRSVGLRVHRTPWGDYGLRPLRDLGPTARARLERARIGRRGLTATQLRLISDALSGAVAEPTSNNERVAAASLQKAGLLEVTGSGLALSEAARFSLLLDDPQLPSG